MRVTVVTAVRPETRAVLGTLGRVRRQGGTPPMWEGMAGENRVTVVQGGVGFARARAAAATIPEACDLVVSFGFAGGLRPGLAPGAFVVCEAVVWEAADGRRRYAVAPALVEAMWALGASEGARTPVARGVLLSSPVILADADAKRSAASVYDAVAVEMEAAPLAALAVRRGISLLPLRAILDPVDLSLAGLPDDLDRSWTGRARLLATPALWTTMLALRRYLVPATATLARAAHALLPTLR